MADFEAVLTYQVALSLDLLHSLGIGVNVRKSRLTPTQDIQFIGTQLDSRKARAFLTKDRALSLWMLTRRYRADVPPRQ